MGSQGAQNLSLGPPGKLALRKTLVTEPKPLAVIDKHPDGRALSIGENKQGSAQGIASKSVSANGAKPVDAGAEINRLHRQKDAHLRADLDHG
jgi:hypothetical protein